MVKSKFVSLENYFQPDELAIWVIVIIINARITPDIYTIKIYDIVYIYLLLPHYLCVHV